MFCKDVILGQLDVEGQRSLVVPRLEAVFDPLMGLNQ
jgi:hypothetical protein